MPSNIDDTKPTALAPTTASVRANMTTAKAEITALQTAVTNAAAAAATAEADAQTGITNAGAAQITANAASVAAGNAQATATAAENHAQTGIANAATAQAAANAAQLTANAAEPSANKNTSTTLGNSDILFPTQNAVKVYVDNSVTSAINDRGNYNASVNTWPAAGGSGAASAIMKGDFWYISVAGTLGGVPVGIGDNIRAGINTPGQIAGNWRVLEGNIGYVPENTANKSTSTALGASDALFPTQNAVKVYADARQTAAEATAAAALATAIATTTINTQTGIAYTFVDGDAIYGTRPPKIVTFANAAAIAVTIPTNAAVPLPIGTRIDCIQDGIGKVTIGGAGVTVNSQGGNKAIAGQYVAVSLIKEAADTWYLIGALRA